MRRVLTLPLLLLVMVASPAGAQARCTGYKWDVSRELALFDTAGLAVIAGKNAASAPALRADRLYRLELLPQPDVAFPVSPGRSADADRTYAGVATLRLKVPGHYRVSVDPPLWIDIAAGARLAVVEDFQGQHDCEGPRKIVEFEVTAASPLVLQLNGSASAAVRLTVTQAPPRKR